MEFAELAQVRRSVRSYTDRPVEREKLEQCIATMRLSPSSNNSQPWRFIVVDDKELKASIDGCVAGFGGMNRFAAQAPVVVAVVMEKANTMGRMASVIQDKEYSLLDIGIAVNQFCLQAADLGLGTCILGWFDEKGIKKALGVPKSRRVPLLITVGYTDQTAGTKTRKPTETVSGWNGY